MTGQEAGALTGVAAVKEALAGQGYLADEALATAVFLAADLGLPLLLEGEAGVGKTEVARALAAATGCPLVRLQCHEGIDVHHALYDWDHPRQILALRAAEAGGATPWSGWMVGAGMATAYLFGARRVVRAAGTEPPAPALLGGRVESGRRRPQCSRAIYCTALIRTARAPRAARAACRGRARFR